MSSFDTEARVILPNLGRRFSGITSTLLQVLAYQRRWIPLVVWGRALAGAGMPTLTLAQVLAVTKVPLSDGGARVYHARRNIEMLWGLILKHLFRRNLKLVFTSTAQRRHTRYTRWLYSRMDAIITTSARAGSFLNRPADHVIPHGIDVGRYVFVADKAAAWARLGLPGRRGIGIFGRVRPQKGIDLFVDAMLAVLPDHPDYTAVIVGRTTSRFASYAGRLQQRIEAAGLTARFVWLGDVDYERLPELYGAMSLVAAVPRVEGFGLTCLEAMSAGAPVIASRTGGFELVIREGIDGALVPCDDADAIVHAFRELAGNEASLAAMARAGRQRVESEFTAEREARRLVDVYLDLSAGDDAGGARDRP